MTDHLPTADLSDHEPPVLAFPNAAAAVQHVAVLVTGNMGAGMARSLLRAGHQVSVWNRTYERAPPLVKAVRRSRLALRARRASGHHHALRHRRHPRGQAGASQVDESRQRMGAVGHHRHGWSGTRHTERHSFSMRPY